MESKIFVFFANPYSFADEGTGVQRTGISVNYLMCDALSDVVNEDGSIGYRPCKCSINLDKKDKLTKVPAFYNGKFTLSQSGNKSVLKLTDLDIVTK